jgi:Flp pilus assembly protein TadG
MGNRLRHLRDDERGISLLWVSMGFMAFFVATTLAIDVGMITTARSQAQNSADAGALSGATALVYDDFDNRSATGPAVVSAINTAKGNDVMFGDVSVLPSDVTFPTIDRVRVAVFRTADRSNPVAALIGPIFGVPTVNVAANATAEASPANAMDCVKPFTIPDQWEEHGTPPWDFGDTFDRYDAHSGEVIPNADIYRGSGSGYNSTRDRGLRLTIRAGTGDNIEPSMYYSWAMPGGSGGDWYRDNIGHCNNTVVHLNDPIIQEPGNMVGPTNQGVDDLIALDPNAYWDDSSRRVISTMHPSPRVIAIPLFDPDYYQLGKVNGRPADLKVSSWIGFFLLNRNGNNVTGIITPITGIYDKTAGPAPQGIFPKVIRLVE